MPNVIVSNEAEKNQLNHILTHGATFTVRQFKSNTTPDANTVIADLVAADYSAATTLTPNVTWGTVATDGAGKAYSLSGDITFPVASSGTQTVYGWALLDNAGALIMCKRFDAPVTVSTTVQVNTFAIKFTLREDS